MIDSTDMPKEYEHLIWLAEQLIADGCEINSALKQVASDHGIPWGDEMGKFLAWGNFIITS